MVFSREHGVGSGWENTKGFTLQVLTGRWFMVFSSFMIMSVSGASYMFGLYSREIKSVLGYDQTTLTLLSFFKDLGSNIGILSGLLNEVTPPWVVLTIGGILNFFGYFMIWLAVSTKIPKPPVWNMCLYIFIGANSHCSTNTGALVTSVKNFPGTRGIVIGLLSGYLGLSGAIITQLYYSFYGNDSKSLILLMAWLPTATTFVLLPFIKHHKGVEQPNDSKAFYNFLYMTLVLAGFLMIIIIVQKVFNFTKSEYYVTSTVMLLLLILPLAVVVIEEKRIWKRKQEHIKGEDPPPKPLNMFSNNNNNNGSGPSGSGTINSSRPLTANFTSATGSADKSSPLWAYVTVLQTKNQGKGNACWRCNYCKKTYKSSYSRVKAHLLREKGYGVATCPEVTSEYIIEMKELDKEATERAKPVQVPLPTGTTSLDPPVDMSKKRRGTDGPLAKSFNNEAREHLSAEIARLIYSGGLPFNVVRNPYFVSAFSYAANTNLSSYVPPSYNAIRTTMLQREKANILKLLQPIKDTWPEKGVSIVTDGWTDAQRRPLINFMAASSSGPMFLKAIDGSGEYKDRHYIANLILSTIDEVGPQNVVQIITDNAPVCKAAGLIVESMHPHIFWTPCVVHTLNLALKNICAPKNTTNNEVVYNECQWIPTAAENAFFIKNFIMNHSMRLAMFNQFVDLKLLAIAETRFASTIVMFKRLRTIKFGLQSMVVSQQWSLYKDDDGGEKATVVKEMILNEQWWRKVDYVLSFTNPIYDMLRSCDTDEPNLHLVYEKWDSMIEQVKSAIYRHEGKELNEHSSFHDVVHKILIDRWTKSYTTLHCMAHSLNPRYYCRQWLDEAPNRVPPHRDNEICTGRNKCLRNYFTDPKERLEATTEFVKFSGAEGEFSQFDSLQDRWNLQPKEWWVMYGSSIPRLQSIALKLLSQPSSSSCCERNWSTYSFIHSLKRNRLNPQRANDLVFVHTNLRLLSRKSKNYNEGATKMWDIAGDEWDLFDGAGILEVASLSLDEPDLEAAVLSDDEHENIDIDTVRD